MDRTTSNARIDVDKPPFLPCVAGPASALLDTSQPQRFLTGRFVALAAAGTRQNPNVEPRYLGDFAGG